MRIMLKYRLIWCLMALFMVSCVAKERENSEEVLDEKMSEKEQQEQIYNEVMDLHDELMPKMNDLLKIRTAIIVKADSLDQLGESSEELRQTIAELEAGEEAMMDWMRHFELLADTIPHDSVINYMTNQREKIMAVKEKMEKAMEEGKSAAGN